MQELAHLDLRRSSRSTSALLEDPYFGERKPFLLQPVDRAVCLEGLDRLVEERLQLAALVQDGSVGFVRDDLPGHPAVGARLLLALRDDDRHVEDQGVALARLDGVEGRTRRGR